MRALLDTHVLLWWVSDPDRLSPDHLEILSTVGPESPVGVSEISLWEIATLYDLGRIGLRGPLRDWLETAVAPPLVQRLGISPAIAAEVAALPASFHRDPADRILVATARVLGIPLLTRDRRILESGVVETR